MTRHLIELDVETLPGVGAVHVERLRSHLVWVAEQQEGVATVTGRSSEWGPVPTETFKLLRPNWRHDGEVEREMAAEKERGE